MKMTNPLRIVKQTSFVFMFCTLAEIAAASTYTFDLTGGAANPSGFNGGDVSSTIVYLTNSSTGLNQLSGISINPGDIINGTVDLSTPITVPAGNISNEILLNLFAINGGSGSVNYSETLTFYENGVQVPQPPEWEYDGASGGLFTLGDFSYFATPSFTFNSMQFSATVMSSANLTTYSPNLLANAFNAVPLPASSWLMLSGVGLLLTLTRRKGVDMSRSGHR